MLGSQAIANGLVDALGGLTRPLHGEGEGQNRCSERVNVVVYPAGEHSEMLLHHSPTDAARNQAGAGIRRVPFHAWMRAEMLRLMPTG